MPMKPPQPLPSLPSREETVPTIQRLNEEHGYVIDDVVQNVDPADASFQNVLKPIAEIENSQSGERHVIAALKYASPDLDIQNAVEEAEKLDLEYQASLKKRKDLFDLIQAVKNRGEALDGEDQRLLEKILLRFTKAGFGKLNEEERREHDELTLQIEDLCTEFNRNIREYQGGLSFTTEDLSGLPTSDLSALSASENGKSYVPLRRRELLLILRYASLPEIRRRMQRAWGVHLGENSSIFKQAALLRDRKARLLRYESHAEAVLHERMAPSVGWVEKMLEDLTEHLAPIGRKEFEDIRRSKHQHLSNILGSSVTADEVEVESWDILYYRRMLEDDLAIDHDRIKGYFPLAHTFNAMLRLFATYFQLRFEEISADERSGHVWADDVSAWAVRDDRQGDFGTFIGYLYADLLARPNKYKGNQAVRLQPGYTKPNGERVHPASTIMCSFQISPSDPHRLLSHAELRSLFHELGHCMHDLLSLTKYQQFHGYNVCLEFGEAIGIMFENWIWMEDVLHDLSFHYTRTSPEAREEWRKLHPGKELPPEKIPPLDLVAPLLKTFQRTRATQLLQQLVDALFDLTTHNPTTCSSLQSLDQSLLYKTLQEKLLLIERPELGYLHTCHAHLMSGMDAGYYAYISATVFAEELFQECFAGDAHSKAAWGRFRRELLEYGGRLNEREILERFLGRSPTPFALLKRLGVDHGK